MTDAKKRLVIGVLLPSCPILSKQTSSLDVHRFSGVLYLQDLRETSDPQHSLASSSSWVTIQKTNDKKKYSNLEALMLNRRPDWQRHEPSNITSDHFAYFMQNSVAVAVNLAISDLYSSAISAAAGLSNSGCIKTFLIYSMRVTAFMFGCHFSLRICMRVSPWKLMLGW